MALISISLLAYKYEVDIFKDGTTRCLTMCCILRSAAPGSEVGPDGQPPVVGGNRNPQQMAAQKRLQQTQAQVDEVSPYLHHLVVPANS